MLGIVAGGMTSCTSDNVSDLPAAVPTRLVFIVEPARAEAGVAFTPAPRVAVQDQFGNTYPAGTTAITVTLAANPAGLTLNGTTTVNSVDGVATFSDLQIDRSGSDYTLFATAPGLTGASTHAFSTSLTFTALSAGGLHTCGVGVSGFMYCWGCWGGNREGQLGNGASTAVLSWPTQVAASATFTAVTTGYSRSCGLTTTAEVYCWGQTWGLTPKAIGGTLRFAQLDGGSTHGCALTTTGTAYCWGENQYGKLGDGTDIGRVAPTPVSGGLTFAVLTAGNAHTCGIATNKVTYCWGYNFYGVLGDGTTTHRMTPVPIFQ